MTVTELDIALMCRNHLTVRWRSCVCSGLSKCSSKGAAKPLWCTHLEQGEDGGEEKGKASAKSGAYDIPIRTSRAAQRGDTKSRARDLIRTLPAIRCATSHCMSRRAVHVQLIVVSHAMVGGANWL